ncbi:uncharacterized protein KZ484_026487 [Pholidichthys leucotaenia]
MCDQGDKWCPAGGLSSQLPAPESGTLPVSPRVLVCLGGCSKVVERKTSYRCCENLPVRFNHSCQFTITSNDENIASIKGSNKHCQLPCKEIKDDQMSLSRCVNLLSWFAPIKRDLL